jgi:hypothetical protein
MERDTSEYQEVIHGPEHYEGRSQSDWDGSCVVITRKEDKGRQQTNDGTIPLKDASRD